MGETLCPFCGQDMTFVERGGQTGLQSLYVCKSCHYQIETRLANRRPIEDALHARAVEAERKLAVAVEALDDIEADAVSVRKAIDQSSAPKRHTPAVLDRIINRKRVALREIEGGE